MCVSISAVVKRRGNYQSCSLTGVPSPRHNRTHISRAVLTRVRQYLRPKMIVITALLLCWNLGNSIVVAVYHQHSVIGADNNNYALPYYHHISHEPQPPHHSQHGNHHHHALMSTMRLRPPPPLSQLSSSSSEPASLLDLGGTGITMSETTALVGPLLRASSPSSSSSSLVPFESASSAPEMEAAEPKRKKSCGQPSVATRGLLGPTLKRSYFAFTQDEVDEKVRNDEYRAAGERKKREIQHKILSSPRQQLAEHETSKRNDGAGETGSGGGAGGTGEAQETPLPWTCETKYEWTDMGVDHYPRFVRTAECKSRLCFNGFFRCRPRRYKTKVLKKIAPADTTSCEDDDVSLPETLRSNWKFITVTISLCCDCTGRIPGNAEV